MRYEHVKPGEYSEIYADITAKPVVYVSLTITGPGIIGNSAKSGTTDGEGYIGFTWQINRYGDYMINGTAGGQSISSSISVK